MPSQQAMRCLGLSCCMMRYGASERLAAGWPGMAYFCFRFFSFFTPFSSMLLSLLFKLLALLLLLLRGLFVLAAHAVHHHNNNQPPLRELLGSQKGVVWGRIYIKKVLYPHSRNGRELVALEWSVFM